MSAVRWWIAIKVLRALRPWPELAERWATSSGLRQALELAIAAEECGRQR